MLRVSNKQAKQHGQENKHLSGTRWFFFEVVQVKVLTSRHTCAAHAHSTRTTNMIRIITVTVTQPKRRNITELAAPHMKN